MFHCLGCRLSDAGVEIHEVLQLICSSGNLGRALSFAFRSQRFQLFLHALLYLKKAPIKAGCLIADHSGLSCRLLTSSQCFLKNAAQCSWGRSETGLSGNPTVTAIQVETAEVTTLWSEYSPYHLDSDFAGLKNWSFIRPLA